MDVSSCGMVWWYVVLLLSCALWAADHLMFVHDLYWENHINGCFSKEMTAVLKTLDKVSCKLYLWAETPGDTEDLLESKIITKLGRKGHCDTWKMSNTAQYLPFKWFQECIWHLNIDWKWSKTVSVWGTNNKKKNEWLKTSWVYLRVWLYVCISCYSSTDVYMYVACV